MSVVFRFSTHSTKPTRVRWSVLRPDREKRSVRNSPFTDSCRSIVIWRWGDLKFWEMQSKDRIPKNVTPNESIGKHSSPYLSKMIKISSFEYRIFSYIDYLSKSQKLSLLSSIYNYSEKECFITVFQCVYIAPLKALVRERVLDWKEKFSKIGIKYFFLKMWSYLWFWEWSKCLAITHPTWTLWMRRQFLSQLLKSGMELRGSKILRFFQCSLKTFDENVCELW